jgi:drug/metabolite transporter (DMT)-like permease
VTIAVVCGLISALCWGISDWLARGISSSMGAFRAQLWSQLTGLLGLAIAVILSGDGVAAVAVGSARAWGFTLLYGAIVGVAALAFFEAFGKGRVAVVAPIVGAYGAVSIAWSVAFGAAPSSSTFVGLVLVIVGVVLASVSPQRGNDADVDGHQAARHRRGTIAAVVAAFLFGTAFFVLGREAAPAFGSLVPALFSRLVGPVVLGGIAVVVGASMAPPTTTGDRLGVIGSGLLSSGAVVATGIGVQRGDVATVAVLGSLSVVVTVLIALVVLRERLAAWQWVGVVVAMLGIPLLASSS